MLRSISGCPSPCMCKWKGGKQTVECGGHKLPSIPDGMDPGTQVLNFSHNSLTVLQSERFQKMELINLQKIFLANNELIRINDRAFRGLSNLVELDLSDNMLTSIPTETFQDYSSLMRLSLSGNPIRDLKTSAFKYLSVSSLWRVFELFMTVRYPGNTWRSLESCFSSFTLLINSNQQVLLHSNSR